MPNHYSAPYGDDESFLPSTPDKGADKRLAANPSTTPAGPPPSSAASFTPLGAPSTTFLESSIIRTISTAPTSRKLFDGHNKPNPPLGRAHHSLMDQLSSQQGREYASKNALPSLPAHRNPTHGQFRVPSDDEDDGDYEDDDEDDDGEGEDEDFESEQEHLYPHDVSQEYDDDPEEEEHRQDFHREPKLRGTGIGAAETKSFGTGLGSFQLDPTSGVDNIVTGILEDDMDRIDGDIFLNLDQEEPPYGHTAHGPYHVGKDNNPGDLAGPDDSDLMMLNTPAATERVRQEAEDIFRAAMRMSDGGRRREFLCTSLAKGLCRQLGCAVISETAEVIKTTEDLLSRLYEQGVGVDDDAARLDESLASVSFQLAKLWDGFASELPELEGEHVAEIGPGRAAEPFKKASFVGQLMLRMHHTRLQSGEDGLKVPPLTEILFSWQNANHNPYPDQLRDVARHKPSPACHALFWQTLRSTLVRGQVGGAIELLSNAGWELQRRGARADYAYTGRALENVRRAADAVCEMLGDCPALEGDWDILGSAWTLFRAKARRSLEKLRLFAEGQDRILPGTRREGGAAEQSLSRLARQAESQIPWDVYENLQTVYELVLGSHTTILETAQDWCEATIGLMGWWVQDREQRHHKSIRLSHSQTARISSLLDIGRQSYDDRLASALHAVFDADFHLDATSAVEVAVASAFEGNAIAVVTLLRAWSLPVACAVAEIASLGHWLPQAEASMAVTLRTQGLDLDDLELLGIDEEQDKDPDMLHGVKDTSLVQYARELAGIDSVEGSVYGWEMAIHVLGRMDSAKRSEETVGELLRDILATLQPDSGATVEKMWHVLRDLGMISFAESVAEAFAEILSRETERYGEALWYYALAHLEHKVRDVLNLLMSCCLVQSSAYPSTAALDRHLERLLSNRAETLEEYGRQDVDAAQLLGRMLSGYAMLRRFYEIRDTVDWAHIPPTSAMAALRKAAAALVAVIASADDSIRGGLYDPRRGAVVSEDFLLALLAEATMLLSPPPPSSTGLTAVSSRIQGRGQAGGVGGFSGAVLTLEQSYTLLKAVEDVQTVGSDVLLACRDFFTATLAAAPGLRGASRPEDLLAPAALSASVSLSGSSVKASRLHGSLGPVSIPRGWDWRASLPAETSSDDVLRTLRRGLAGELALLWVEAVDNVPLY